MFEDNRSGATIWARKAITSEIFTSKPVAWFKIWFFLVNRVNHQRHRKWDKGECLTSYNEICQYTGATHSEVDHCMRWLRKENMIATRKAIRGMHLKVIKYGVYQDFDTYKSDLSAKHRRYRGDTINNNDNNVKKKLPYSKSWNIPLRKDSQGKWWDVSGGTGNWKEFVNGESDIIYK